MAYFDKSTTGGLKVMSYEDDVVRPLPAVDKQIARLGTLVIASPCAQRADRIALLAREAA